MYILVQEQLFVLIHIFTTKYYLITILSFKLNEHFNEN